MTDGFLKCQLETTAAPDWCAAISSSAVQRSSGLLLLFCCDDDEEDNEDECFPAPPLYEAQKRLVGLRWTKAPLAWCCCCSSAMESSCGEREVRPAWGGC